MLSQSNDIMPPLAAPSDVATLREMFKLSAADAMKLLYVANYSLDNAIDLYEPDFSFDGPPPDPQPPMEQPAAAADEPAPPPAPARPHHTRSPFASAARALAKHRRRKESHLLRAAGVDLQHRPDQHVSERRRQRTKDVAFARGMAAERELSKQRRGAKRKSKKQAKAQRRADHRAARHRAAAQ